MRIYPDPACQHTVNSCATAVSQSVAKGPPCEPLPQAKLNHLRQMVDLFAARKVIDVLMSHPSDPDCLCFGVWFKLFLWCQISADQLLLVAQGAA